MVPSEHDWVHAPAPDDELWAALRAAYKATHRDNIPFIAPGEKDAQRTASNRVWRALLLASTPAAWFALIRGETLPADQIDRSQAQRAKRRMGAR